MIRITKVKSRENEFVSQLIKLLTNTFPPPLTFKVKYFIGEEKDSGKTGLYFELSFGGSGLLYSTFRELKDYEVPSDIEDEFFAKISNDLLFQL